MNDVKVNKKIYNLNLPHRAISVYCYLCDRADRYGKCFPSTTLIADDLGISRRTVFRALNDLETANLLHRERRRRTHGGNTSNLYCLEVNLHV